MAGLMAILLLLQAAFWVMPALAASGTVKTLAELKTQLKTAVSDDVITVTGTIAGDSAEPIEVPDGVTLTGGALSKINLISTGTLTLKGITITGTTDAEGKPIDAEGKPIAAVKAQTLVIQGNVSVTGANAAGISSGQGAVYAGTLLDIKADSRLTAKGGTSRGDGKTGGAGITAGSLLTATKSLITAIGGAGTPSNEKFAGNGGSAMVLTKLEAPSGGSMTLSATLTGGAGGSNADANTGGKGGNALVITTLTGDGVTLLGTYSGGVGGNGAVYGGAGGAGLDVATLGGNGVTMSSANRGGVGGSGAISGGQGGHGVRIGNLTNTAITLAGSSVGGNGGAGLAVTALNEAGGSGGNGGNGITIDKTVQNVVITAPSAVVKGGDGGRGGNSAYEAGGNGGQGGGGLHNVQTVNEIKLNEITSLSASKGGAGGTGKPNGKAGGVADVLVGANAPITNVTFERDRISISLELASLPSLTAEQQAHVTIRPVYFPSGATPVGVTETWTSSAQAVATVDKGVVTPVKEGSARITLTLADSTGKTIVSKSVTVYVTKPVMRMEMKEASPLEMKSGEQKNLVLTVDPLDSNRQYLWESDDETKATVESIHGNVNAVVRAHKPGTARITATVLDGSGQSAEILVNVSPTPLTRIAINTAGLTTTLNVGQTVKLPVSYTPSNGSIDTRLRWETDTPSVARVDEQGVVTAIGIGKAVITAISVENEKLTSKVTITVLDSTVTGVKVTPVSAKVKVGATTTLKAEVTPKNGNQTVTWSSSHPSIASVDNGGKVTGISQGTATITARTVEGGFTAAATVTVEGSLVTISPGSLKLLSGDSATVKATVASGGAASPTIIWISGNTRIATVDQKGNVRAYEDGRTTITAWVNGGRMSASIDVVVGDVDVTGVKITPATLTLAPGMGEMLAAQVVPESALLHDVTWHSSNPNVVTVDKYGRILAVASKGKATIVATSVDGQKTGKAVVSIGEVPVTNVSIKAPATSIAPGSSLNLSYALEPVDAPVSRVEWSSSDPRVAVVNTSGRVSALATGTTTIIVKVTDGTSKASVKEASIVLNVQQGGSTQPMSGMVIAGKLNVRAGGNSAAQVLGTISRGEVVQIIKHLGNWYQIQYNGRIAYASAAYISADRTAMVYSNTLTVRTQPNSSARRLATMLYGDRVTVLGSTGSWYKIDYRGIIAYAAAQHLVLTPTERVGVVGSSVLTVRERAGSGYAAVGQLRAGDVVPVIGREGAWLRVEYGGRVAYVAAGYVQVS